MKKIFLFSLLLGLGVLTLSACSKEIKQPETPVFNANTNMSVEDAKLKDGNYTVLNNESQVAWSGQKILGANHSGQVAIKSANLEIKDANLSGGGFILDMTTISSDEDIEALVKHLKSDDFFDVENYQEASLIITGAELMDNSNYNINADLVIKDISVPINFEANVKQEGEQIIAISDFVIDRTLWNIRYGSGDFFKDLGDAAIEDEIGFKVYLTAQKQ